GGGGREQLLACVNHGRPFGFRNRAFYRFRQSSRLKRQPGWNGKNGLNGIYRLKRPDFPATHPNSWGSFRIVALSVVVTRIFFHNCNESSISLLNQNVRHEDFLN